MSIGLALSQVQRIEGLCDFLDHPGVQQAVERNVPFTMPRTVGALGFDIPIWVGLGIVGLWAALDAYAERTLADQRCGVCRRSCLEARYRPTGHLDATLGRSLNE